MLEISNLKKSFKNNTVLKNVSFNICEGDIIYIQGINGSGKTTLFKIICDILEKDEGILIKKKDVKIGALIENPNFLENENLLFNLKFLASINNNYNYDNIEKLVSLFLLDINSKDKLKSYSLGMRQKVGIIQAIMEDQNLLIFDEPTRGLDKQSIKTFTNLVNLLSNKGKAIIIASHDYISDIQYTHFYTLIDGYLIKEK